MPFDQFTIEQIAGDLLPDATESQKIATGFHRCAATNVEAGSLPELIGVLTPAFAYLEATWDLDQ